MNLRYPIGDFSWKGRSTPADRRRYIAAIARTPPRMRKAVKGKVPRPPWRTRDFACELPRGYALLTLAQRLNLARTPPRGAHYLAAQAHGMEHLATETQRPQRVVDYQSYFGGSSNLSPQATARVWLVSYSRRTTP
jgi:hypothetical protein